MLRVIALSHVSILSSWARCSPTRLVVPSAVGLNNKCKKCEICCIHHPAGRVAYQRNAILHAQSFWKAADWMWSSPLGGVPQAASSAMKLASLKPVKVMSNGAQVIVSDTFEKHKKNLVSAK